MDGLKYIQRYYKLNMLHRRLMELAEIVRHEEDNALLLHLDDKDKNKIIMSNDLLLIKFESVNRAVGLIGNSSL